MKRSCDKLIIGKKQSSLRTLRDLSGRFSRESPGLRSLVFIHGGNFGLKRYVLFIFSEILKQAFNATNLGRQKMISINTVQQVFNSIVDNTICVKKISNLPLLSDINGYSFNFDDPFYLNLLLGCLRSLLYVFHQEKGKKKKDNFKIEIYLNPYVANIILLGMSFSLINLNY